MAGSPDDKDPTKVCPKGPKGPQSPKAPLQTPQHHVRRAFEVAGLHWVDLCLLGAKTEARKPHWRDKKVPSLTSTCTHAQQRHSTCAHGRILASPQRSPAKEPSGCCKPEMNATTPQLKPSVLHAARLALQLRARHLLDPACLLRHTYRGPAVPEKHVNTRQPNALDATSTVPST